MWRSRTDASGTSSSRRGLDRVRIEASGYVDASGDASLSYEAGLEVREPEAPVYGSLNFSSKATISKRVEGLVIKDVHDRLADTRRRYGLVRHDGFLMHFPGKDFMLANVTHLETPLDPLADRVDGGRGTPPGRQRDPLSQGRVPARSSRTRAIRTYGNPGLRQTRWIVGRRQLTLDDIRSGGTAGGRGRPLRLVGRAAQREGSGPLGAVRARPRLLHPARRAWCRGTPTTSSRPAAASTRTFEALSAIRVMGPCIAMGAAAAHALDLAGSGPVHDIDLAELQERLTTISIGGTKDHGRRGRLKCATTGHGLHPDVRT